MFGWSGIFRGFTLLSDANAERKRAREMERLCEEQLRAHAAKQDVDAKVIVIKPDGTVVPYSEGATASA